MIYVYNTYKKNLEIHTHLSLKQYSLTRNGGCGEFYALHIHIHTTGSTTWMLARYFLYVINPSN